MSESGVSQHLKKCMEDIKDILSKYDVAGTIFLADGKGCGEFLIGIERPTWSNIRFIPRQDGSMAIHTKVHMASSPENTQRTINALYNLQGQIGNVFMMQDSITKDWEKKLDIEKEDAKIIPHRRMDS